MSSTGNRSNPNRTRLQGRADDDAPDPNRSDVAKRAEADSKTSGGRAPMAGTGSNRETREHNKHDHRTQGGHKPHKHGPAEEKN